MARAPVIAVVSQKGGAGKTTLAMQLAGGLMERRARVLVGDLDPQESALRWSEAASAEAECAFDARRLVADDLGAGLRRLREEVDYLVLDTPPSIEHAATLAAIDAAHLVLVPAVPSPTDLWSTRAVERLILARIAENRRLKACLVPNRVQRTALSGEAIDLMHEFDLPVLRAALAQRNAYAQSAVIGASVFQLGKVAQAAQAEVRQLVAAVRQQLGESP